MPVFLLKKNSRQKLSKVIKYFSYCHTNKACEISGSYGSEYKGGIFLDITPCILNETTQSYIPAINLVPRASGEQLVV
jgi:hypothetical protein